MVLLLKKSLSIFSSLFPFKRTLFLIFLIFPQVEKTLAASKECREKELKEHTADLQKR